MNSLKYLFIIILVFIATSCTAQPTAPATSTNKVAGVSPTSEEKDFSTLPPFPTISPSTTPDTGTKTPTASITIQPSKTARVSTKTATSTPTITPLPTLGASDWKKLPVVPQISNSVVEIYQRGLDAGNNPRAFSKIGDCGSTPAWFLGDFDRGPQFYRLGDYTSLEPVIQKFQGSFGRTSLAARSGFNAPSLFVPLWADRTYCLANETPLACEYRVHQPVIAFIMLGANDVWHPEEFEPQMRKIIEFSINSGVIPILSTKADNQEGNDSLNETIARLAFEYDIPLWNYWRAVQDLPDKGLQEDKVHLTFGRNFFDDPEAMSKAWPVRNLTALQILEAVWRAMIQQSS